MHVVFVGKEIFGGGSIQITTDGKHHLIASLGSGKCKNKYFAFKVDERVKELETLSEIDKISTASSLWCCYYKISP